MDEFKILWPLCFLACIVILGLAGKAAGKGLSGALIDKRGRYSLNRFQFVMWSTIILSALVTLVLTADLKLPEIEDDLLALIGISTASVATAAAVKHSKDVQAVAAANEAATLRAASAQQSGNLSFDLLAIRAASQPVLPEVPTALRPRPAQMLLEEEGAQADQIVSVTKYQNLILTLAAGAVLSAQIWSLQSLDLQLSDGFLWLLGISHAGYVGGKVPNKT